MDNSNENNIRFSDLIYLFVSRLWVMLLVAVVVGASLFSYSYFTYKPEYKSTASMYILRQSEGDENADYSSDFNVALNVVNDCKELLTTHKVIDKVIETEKLDYTYGQLVSMITVKSEQNSRLLEITVKSSSPQMSKKIVDSVCAIGEKAIDDLMGYDQINIVHQGILEKTPCNTRFSYTFVLGAIAAFILTYVVLVLIYIFDDKISDPDEVERVLDLPVLALIPNMKSDKKALSSKNGKYATARHRYYANNRKERY